MLELENLAEQRHDYKMIFTKCQIEEFIVICTLIYFCYNFKSLTNSTLLMSPTFRIPVFISH